MNSFLKYAIIVFSAAVLIFVAGVSFGNEQYDREKHFPHWLDLDRDGLNTKQEALADQSIDGRFWVCPYTGTVVTDPKKLAPDHVVSLKTAWECGASEWHQETRILFANDPENILMVLAPVNSSKSDKRPEEWMPLNIAFWDDFITKTRYIYAKYDLRCPDPDPVGVLEATNQLKGITPKNITSLGGN